MNGGGRSASRAIMHAALCLAFVAGVAPAPGNGKARIEANEPALEAALRGHIKILASDEFAGREPGTPGETKALRYLARQWFDIGLESGTNDPGHAWFAPVELVARTPQASRASFVRGKRRMVAMPGDAFVATSGLRSLVSGAPLFFVGDGTRPVPARQELAGRIALLLDSLPAGADPDRFADRAGRLLDGGASAVVTVLDAERGLSDVRSRRGRAGYALAGDRLGGDIEGYVTPAFAERLLAGGSEGDLAALRRSARAREFTPRPIGVSATLEATTRETRIHTHNLIGRLPGRNPAAGAVVLVAHWDHFGICGEAPAVDVICNGAVDNASGLAVVTEAMRMLAKGPPIDRDVYVLATTGEEFGLLGAQAFTENPPLPLRKIVAVFNVDSDAIAPAGTPFAILGRGKTGLDAEIERVIARAKRKLVSGQAANMFLRRQDGWAFLQHDVPAVSVSTAYGDQARFDRYMDTRYHRPADKPTPDLELGGAADDARMLVDLARNFGDVKAWPGTEAPITDAH